MYKPFENLASALSASERGASPMLVATILAYGGTYVPATHEPTKGASHA